MDDSDALGCYVAISYLFGGLAFLAIWIYAFYSWGFLIGLAIGWLPALIGGWLVGLLWPLAVLAAIGIALLVYWSQL
jgi:hypothetical protein